MKMTVAPQLKTAGGVFQRGPLTPFLSRPSIRREAQDSQEDRERNRERMPSIVREVLSSPGRPLDAGTRSFMEPRFGHDFSRVRVHTDEEAAASARSVNALAYTVNQHVVFGPEQYHPQTAPGQRLIAHELAHTLQQRNAPRGAHLDPAYAEAEAHAHRAVEALDKPAGTMGSLHLGAFALGLYRQTAGGSASVAPPADGGMTEAEFEKKMRRKYGTATIRTGTQVEQTADVASRVRQPANAVTLPKWQSWDPGASSPFYDLVLQSLSGF
jgi:hypothetical protein